VIIIQAKAVFERRLPHKYSTSDIALGLYTFTRLRHVSFVAFPCIHYHVAVQIGDATGLARPSVRLYGLLTRKQKDVEIFKIGTNAPKAGVTGVTISAHKTGFRANIIWLRMSRRTVA